MSSEERERKKAELLDRLGALLDDIDEQTRRPGEESLRVAVARQAREALEEMGS